MAYVEVTADGDRWETVLRCDMQPDCWADVTMIDGKGFVYCAGHGLDRRMHQVACRKLRSHELARLNRGEPLARYYPKDGA